MKGMQPGKGTSYFSWPILTLMIPQPVYCGVLSLKKKAGRDMPQPRLQSLSAMCPPWFPFGRVFMLRPPCVRPVLRPPGVRFGLIRIYVMYRPCVCLVSAESALAPPPDLAYHLSSMCSALVRFLVSALEPCPPYIYVSHVTASCPPCGHFGRASKPCPPCLVCVQHVSALSAQIHHVALASGLFSARGLLKYNVFSAFCNPPRLYCMPAGQFPWHSFRLPNSVFASAPYAWKLFGVYAGIIFWNVYI